MMEKRSTARRANGYVATVLVVFFMCAHILLGSLSLVTPIDNRFAWVVWIGSAVILVHICLSIATTREKLSNTDKPANPSKKRKIALRWITGILVAVAAGMHIVSVELYGESAIQASPLGWASVLALIVILTVHITLNIKSLIRDVGGSKELKERLRTPLRIAICLLAAAFFIIVVIFTV